MVETVQQYWPKGRSRAREEWMLGRYSNTLIGWHYEFKKKKIIWKLDAFLYIKQS